MTDWTPILSGIVGSTAYGLAGPGSDVDRMAFAAAPTTAFHGLHAPTGKSATRVTHEPDSVTHEIGKACSLMLQCNPSVIEMLWLPVDLYESWTTLGSELIEIRSAFLSRRSVRDAYFGYATQQFKRLRNREDGTFSSDVRKRTEKHARHIWRLITQCRGLYLTGELTIRLTPAEVAFCREFGRVMATNLEEGLERAERLLAVTTMALDSVQSPLPEHPDVEAVEKYLRHARGVLLDQERHPESLVAAGDTRTVEPSPAATPENEPSHDPDIDDLTPDETVSRVR